MLRNNNEGTEKAGSLQIKRSSNEVHQRPGFNPLVRAKPRDTARGDNRRDLSWLCLCLLLLPQNHLGLRMDRQERGQSHASSQRPKATPKPGTHVLLLVRLISEQRGVGARRFAVGAGERGLGRGRSPLPALCGGTQSHGCGGDSSGVARGQLLGHTLHSRDAQRMPPFPSGYLWCWRAPGASSRAG